jgi:hypothetical protein
VLPPWPATYTTDAERDHPYEHAVRVHGEVVRWYASLGFEIDTVPCTDVAARAEHVLARLQRDGCDTAPAAPGTPPALQRNSSLPARGTMPSGLRLR